MRRFDLDQLLAQQREAGHAYLEFLRVPEVSMGVYTLPVGGTHPQEPHREDEVYVVLEGRGQIRVGDESFALVRGSVVYVPARVPHRFHAIEEELRVLVFFAPAESS
jgi:mannose-6-phosphate isomerase-like protein (cupin superfamily)